MLSSAMSIRKLWDTTLDESAKNKGFDKSQTTSLKKSSLDALTTPRQLTNDGIMSQRFSSALKSPKHTGTDSVSSQTKESYYIERIHELS